MAREEGDPALALACYQEGASTRAVLFSFVWVCFELGSAAQPPPNAKPPQHTALRLDPSPDIVSNVGCIYKEMGRVEEAMTYYHTAIALQPGHVVAIGNLGSCLLDRGDVDLALETLQTALAIQPHADIWNNLGNALRQKGRLDEAIASYQQALQLRPDHAHAYNNLGNSMKDKGMVLQATECYVKVRLQTGAWGA